MSMSTGGSDDDTPIGEMNTTPLIDVMLVLLIMFIITIPVQTHAVKINLPVNNPNPPPITIKPDFNTVSVNLQNAVTWNGAPIDLVTLRTYLDQTKTMSPEPELHIQPEPYSRYAKVDEMLAVVKRSEVSKVGFVGNEAFANFGK
ncbi:MAG: biopolymer transporter ExbD [Sphingomonadales bacterium]